MRTGRFEEALSSVKRAFALLETCKEQFKGDLEVVMAKFYTLQCNVNYILKNYQDCLDSATEGVKCVDSVKSQEVTIMKAMNNARRDLMNCKVRSRAKMEGKPASEIRGEKEPSHLEKMTALIKARRQA